MKWLVLAIIAGVIFACSEPSKSNPTTINPETLACKHCRHTHVDPALISALNQLQIVTGKTLEITSGYRCPTHNRSIGGACHSWHLAGQAADIRCPGFTPAQLAVKALEIEVFREGGIGIYPTHIHVDLRHTPTRWGTWLTEPEVHP